MPVPPAKRSDESEITLLADYVLAPLSGAKTIPLIGMLAMVGRKYARQLMVIGRAPNGWDHVDGWKDGIASSDLDDAERRSNFAQAVYRSVTAPKSSNECPMSWVTNQWGCRNGYSTARSPFWRVIRAVVERLDIADVDGLDWPCHLVWSNLYKAAPAQGGNPNGKLQRMQVEGCRRLLQWELEKFRPRRLVFLTGWDWAEPFLDQKLRDRTQLNGQLFVERAGHLDYGFGTADCVVAQHPQGKPEAFWVDEVMSAFGALGCRPNA